MITQNNRERVWQRLAAVVGNPSLRPTHLVGDLEEEIPVLNQEKILATLLRESPEVKKAQAGVERARATLQRAKAEPTPNLFLRAGLGYNFDRFDDGERIGLEGFVGAKIPLSPL